MPQLDRADVYADPLLTNVGVKFSNPDYAHIELQPTISVSKPTGSFFEFGKSIHFRDEVKPLAAGVPAPSIQLDLSTTSYRCNTYGIRAPLPREIRDVAEPQLQLQAQLAALVADKLQLTKEIRCSSLYFTAAEDTTWLTYQTNDPALGQQWYQDTAEPVKNINDMKLGVRKRAPGRRANHIHFGCDAWEDFRIHPKVIDFLYAGGDRGPKIVTQQMVADAFEVDRVTVGWAQYTTDAEPATAAQEAAITYTDIWGPHCWVGHVSRSPSIFNPTAAYFFQEFYRLRGYTIDETETEYVEGRESVTEQVISAACGAYIFNATATKTLAGS